MTADALFNPLVEQAIELAAEWHDQTYRKSRWRTEPFEPPPEVVLHIPVMAHVTAVALTIQRAGWPDEAVAAAFLHDVIEDRNRFAHGMTRGRLAAAVGEAVADLVAYVTEPKWGPDGEALPWRARKEAYLATLAEGPPEALAISLADKIHNVWSMNQALAAGIDIFNPGPHRRAFSAGPEEQRWFLNSVLAGSERHADARLEPMRERLAAEMERFQQLTSRSAEAG
jgi:(p)ppGpp synthase/HD superfamily hydrolase